MDDFIRRATEEPATPIRERSVDITPMSRKDPKFDNSHPKDRKNGRECSISREKESSNTEKKWTRKNTGKGAKPEKKDRSKYCLGKTKVR